MKFIKIGLLLLLTLTIGMFALYKIKRSGISKPNPPVIEDSLSTVHVKCNCTDDELLEGLTATDEIDGDITDKIMIGEYAPLDENNTSSYKCIVFNSAGEYAECERSVVFDDYIHPRIYLTTPLVYHLDDTAYHMPRESFYARDKIDGDTTDRIQLFDSNIDYTEKGDYYITAGVDNSLGDSVQYTFPVHVLEKNTSLYIRLTQYVTYCKQGSDFNPLRYVKETSNDIYTSRDPFELTLESNVDMNTPGVYEVAYTLSSEALTVPAKTYLTVIVLE